MSKFSPLYNNPTKVIEIPNFFSKEEIIEVSKIVKLLPSNLGSIKHQNTQGSHSSRKSIIKWIDPIESNLWLYNKFQDIIQEINSTVYRFDLKGWADSIQYTEYSEEYEGKYDWHVDVGQSIASYRKISLSLQLSEEEEYEGGDLQTFPLPHPTTPPYSKKQGNLIIFPSFTAHRVIPVTKGIRRSLVWWVGGCPFR
jgi:PKHD-type hydroxylase